MRSNFASARRHLEEAHRLLAGDDELSGKSRQALEILIDAFLTTEYSGDAKSRRIVDLAEVRELRSRAVREKAVPVA